MFSEKRKMDKTDPRLIQMRELAQQLRYKHQRTQNVIAVLLFGSVATGDIHEKSNLDIVVIENTDREKTERNLFTELTDAEKHHTRNEDFLAAASLQNGAFYLDRFGLRQRNIKLGKQGFLFPETHVELAKKTKEHWRTFYDFSRKIHSCDN